MAKKREEYDYEAHDDGGGLAMDRIPDERPDWVRSLMRFARESGHPVEARDEGMGRWSFVPCGRNDQVGTGTVAMMHMPDGEVRPAIKDTDKWLDLRTQEGRQLHLKHHEAA